MTEVKAANDNRRRYLQATLILHYLDGREEHREIFGSDLPALKAMAQAFYEGTPALRVVGIWLEEAGDCWVYGGSRL